MKYMLLLYADESKMPQTPEAQQAVAPAWYALGKELDAAGVLLSNHGLDPIVSPTTVRVKEGKTLVTDGSFAETHEQLGGYYLVDCKDLEEAIGWAEKIPTAKYGSMEVRPLNRWSQ
ncbi:MAG TPA: YciI family protein [Anaerolineales bacterium]|nr:YciI family protein [Anaerolineales bacterium]